MSAWKWAAGVGVAAVGWLLLRPKKKKKGVAVRGPSSSSILPTELGAAAFDEAIAAEWERQVNLKEYRKDPSFGERFKSAITFRGGRGSVDVSDMRKQLKSSAASVILNTLRETALQWARRVGSFVGEAEGADLAQFIYYQKSTEVFPYDWNEFSSRSMGDAWDYFALRLPADIDGVHAVIEWANSLQDCDPNRTPRCVLPPV